MATSPLGGFANLSRYQQAAAQPRANILDSVIQGLNQGISLAQLPDTLRQENELKQQQLILGRIKTALAQKNLYDIEHPDEALAREVKKMITMQNIQRQIPGAEEAPEGFGGQVMPSPGAVEGASGDLTNITERPAGVPLGAPTTPMKVNGIDLGFNYNPATPIAAAEKAKKLNLENIEQEEAAKGRGKLPFEKAKLKAEAEAKGTKATPLNFQKFGNTVVAFDPFSSKEISRTVVPEGYVDVKTENGLFIGKPDDPSSFKLVPGTAPIVTQKENVSEDYRNRKSEEILNSITDLKSRVGLNTVGVGGAAARKLPINNEAKDFAADLTALTSQIAFRELTEMRAASKTGGALGQVSDKEGELLKSAIAGLTLDQGPENFIKNLNRVEASLKRWDAAKAKHGVQAPPPAAPPPASNVSPDDLNAIRATHGLPSQ